MAKKEEIKPKEETEEIIENEEIEETEEIEEKPVIKKVVSKKPVNLMENAEVGGKDKQEQFNPLDLSPIMNELKNLDKKVSDALEGKKPKNEESLGKNLIEELGDW